jgi:hypothetical protein
MIATMTTTADVLALFPKCSGCGTALDLRTCSLDPRHDNRALCDRCAAHPGAPRP